MGEHRGETASKVRTQGSLGKLLRGTQDRNRGVIGNGEARTTALGAAPTGQLGLTVDMEAECLQSRAPAVSLLWGDHKVST
jgi:hypothetical protein